MGMTLVVDFDRPPGFGRHDEFEFTEQVITFDRTREISVGMVFPMRMNGFICGKGFYQLSQQREQHNSSFHRPVMVKQVVSWWVTDVQGWYVDATIGGGGHAEALLQRFSPGGRLVGIDRDQEAIDFSRERLRQWQDQILLRQANFHQIKQILAEEGIQEVAGILLDLGLSSHQLDADYRGFSYLRDGPLDMRMDRTQRTGAFHVINTYTEQELQEMIKNYGEERRAGAIARAIVKARRIQKIESTRMLAHIVAGVLPPAHLNKSLSRVFQSIRIEVNSELRDLQAALQDGLEVLKPGGRLVVLSYHSLEDRLVKQFFRENENRCTCPPELPQCICHQEGKLKILTRRPLTPAEEEIRVNPRARSAKMRVAERIGS